MIDVKDLLNERIQKWSAHLRMITQNIQQLQLQLAKKAEEQVSVNGRILELSELLKELSESKENGPDKLESDV